MITSAATSTSYLEFSPAFNNKNNNNKKKKLVVIVISAIVLCAIIAAILLVKFKDNNNVQEEEAIVIQMNSSNPLDLKAGGYFALPRSSLNQIFLLQKKNLNPQIVHDTPAGRSYDGFDWEPVFPNVIPFNCNEQYCRVRIPRDGPDYVLSPVDSRTRSDEQLIADYLIQVTFGPTRDMIRAFPKGEGFKERAKAFLLEQINTPPTLHREYFRRRANAYFVNDTKAGSVRGPCEIGSRWERAVFDFYDSKATLRIENGAFVYVNHELRTELQGIDRVNLNGNWKISDISSQNGFVGASITISNGTANLQRRHPALYFSARLPDPELIVHSNADFIKLDPDVDNVVLLKSASLGCVAPSNRRNLYAKDRLTGIWYRYHPRLRLIDNTIEKPALPSKVFRDPVWNPSAPKDFLNENSCIPTRAQGITQFKSQRFALNSTVLRNFYQRSGVYAYYMTGLLPNAGPCQSQRARFIRSSDLCSGSVNSTNPGYAYLSQLIQNKANGLRAEAFVVDVDTLSSSTCSSFSAGIKLKIGTTCWTHVHSDFHSVFDFTAFADMHGGSAASILGKAQSGLVEMRFPHQGDAMCGEASGCWDNSRSKLAYMGIFGYEIDFLNLPNEARQFGIASYLGAISSKNVVYYERCGSAGEVQNDPSKGNRFTFADTGALGKYLDIYQQQAFAFDSKYYVWTNIALFSKDQVRQRVAWGLSQIFVVTSSSINHNAESEIWQKYYDIFVRNAFGNYFDIMKEVSYSPMMATMLSYLGSVSFERSGVAPDENYARELMQLFSLGLWQLNKNGTRKSDSTGRTLETYTNADIANFAKVWTGFESRKDRGNIERTAPNLFDTMSLDGLEHDSFPKHGLEENSYIGDGFPLCRSLPKRSFLRKGAKYRFLGSENFQVLYARKTMLDLSELNSNLYTELCNRQGGSSCVLRSTILLPNDIACSGVECNVETIRTVRLNLSSTESVYYEYVQLPCIELEFPENGASSTHVNGYEKVCVDRRSARASALCCNANSKSNGVIATLYDGEIVSYPSAEKICMSRGMQVCRSGISSYSDQTLQLRTWRSDPCTVYAQVFDDGTVSIVHQVNGSISDINGLQMNSKIKIRIYWEGNKFPIAASQCSGICQVHGNSCLCPTQAQSSVVFSDSMKIPSVDQVLESLKIGASDPISFDSGSYVLFFEDQSSGLSVFVDAVTRKFDAATIFVVKSIGSRVRYFANIRSEVLIGTSFKFRNPPNFMLHEERNVRDAENEVDAVLKHYLYHPNCAPFVADFMNKRMVTSNPSPAYIQAVSDAFMSGKFEGFGSGNYGDMVSTVAAILLYRDALSSTLKSDVSHGKMREPLLKLIHLMRSLEIVSKKNREIDLKNLDILIAQEPYQAPSVFNYYVSEYQPAGAVASANLYAPEAQLLNMPRVTAFINALVNLIEFGLSDCDLSFGYSLSISSCSVAKTNPNLYNSGYFNLSSLFSGLNASAVVDRLDLLLMGGRLDENRRNIMLNAFQSSLKSGSSFESGTKSMIELFISSPEYQISSMASSKGVVRPAFKAPSSQYNDQDYQAVIFLLLEGGMDSYNLIVPYGNCANNFDLYEQYRSIRGNASLPRNRLLEINVPLENSQPCQKFGIIDKMPLLKELYDSSDASFIANIGTLVEPMTVMEYKNNIKRKPVGLFAHNIQQKVIQSMVADSLYANGVLGRIHDYFTSNNKYASSYAVHGAVSAVLEGDFGVSAPQDVIDPSNGISLVNEDRFASTKLEQYLLNLTDSVSNSIFADTWNGMINYGMKRSSILSQTLKSATITTDFSKLRNYVANQLEYVSRVIASRSKLKSNLDLFHLRMPGFDSHFSFTEFGDLMSIVDADLSAFVSEMKAQNIWDKVTVVVASDFGRTLRSNGKGTDHAWGGNTFFLGGSVKGGQILGKYPSNLAEGGEVNIGNGSLMPTTSWESLWNAVCEWLNIPESAMNDILPNRPNFSSLYKKNQLFRI
jgi:cullin-associated NEDD8-dissociated protein 1